MSMEFTATSDVNQENHEQAILPSSLPPIKTRVSSTKTLQRKMGSKYIAVSIFTILLLPLTSVVSRPYDFLKLPSDRSDGEADDVGTRWAVLVAGSNGYMNYRHQADICHAYQILKNGGLKDENIIVFMYDDIAYNAENPRPGVIINHPEGENVYAGVPKDYVGRDVSVHNFFAVLLGDKSALKGGSGKVVNSGPNDHIFIFYSDHGGPGVLGMPTYPYLYADDLVDVLLKKHAMGTYKSMVFYLEACEAGSIFEGLLPKDINVYATTASNSVENSWGTYCPGEYPSPPAEYYTCLGDLYSIAWMEDSDSHNLRSESLKQQYQLVKTRTSAHNTYNLGSHVMQYGNLDLSADRVFMYMGSNPANENLTFVDNVLPLSPKAVNQRDADLVYFWHKFKRSPEGSSNKLDAQRQLVDAMAHRLHIDNSIQLVGQLIFGTEKGMEVLKTIRPEGQPLVDDWSCLKWIVRTFETHCGSLSQYGMKHMRSLANICNTGVRKETMSEVASQACPSIPNNIWSSLHNGFSA